MPLITVIPITSSSLQLCSFFSSIFFVAVVEVNEWARKSRPKARKNCDRSSLQCDLGHFDKLLLSIIQSEKDPERNNRRSEIISSNETRGIMSGLEVKVLWTKQSWSFKVIRWSVLRFIITKVCGDSNNWAIQVQWNFFMFNWWLSDNYWDYQRLNFQFQGIFYSISRILGSSKSQPTFFKYFSQSKVSNLWIAEESSAQLPTSGIMFGIHSSAMS